MKKTLITLAALATVSVAFADVTVDLTPSWSLNAVGNNGLATLDKAGNLADWGPQGANIYEWIGDDADGWYSSTQNGDMMWGSGISYDAATDTISVSPMTGCGGNILAMKTSVALPKELSSLTLTFDLEKVSGQVTGSFWYERTNGEVWQIQAPIGMDATENDGLATSYTWSMTDSQIADFNANGTGEIYLLFGFKNGSDATPTLISDITTTATVPEPTTATLSLLALAGLAARRRRK